MAQNAPTAAEMDEEFCQACGSPNKVVHTVETDKAHSTKTGGLVTTVTDVYKVRCPKLKGVGVLRQLVIDANPFGGMLGPRYHSGHERSAERRIVRQA